jgi:hypothetical protein
MHDVSEEASSFLRYTEEGRSLFRNVVYLVGWDNGKSSEGICQVSDIKPLLRKVFMSTVIVLF